MRETNHRIGIIGYGGFGKFLARAWSGLDGAAVTAVADVHPVTAPPEFAYFSGWRELLDSGLVDVVSVVTPPNTHTEIAAAALEKGIHVLVEKPIAVTVDDARRLVEAEKASQATAAVDFMLRYNPIVECMQDWSGAQWFGPLQRVVVENYAQDESMGPDHWFWDPEISGGILIEHAVHFIDIVNGCTDAPVKDVTGRSWRRKDGREDRVAIDVGYEDGLVASQYHAFNRIDAFERTSLHFVFAGAQVDVAGWIPMSGRIVAMSGKNHEGVLEQLPNLSIVRDEPLDASRNVPLEDLPGQHEVDRIVEATFAIRGTKEDAYLDALRKLMQDFLRVVDGDAKSMRVTLEDGLKSLEIASEGTTDIRHRINQA
ncbi:MAG TPA: Gfo/Idh/MocA family oxidoreductase [Rhodothermales bacterium]|nr:Gfo/Idh/MocA family oxidoreductase [Rhodothermales bacterium]